MIKRVLFEGFKNIIRSFWLSATAILVLTVSLASVVLIATLSTTVSFAVQNFDRTVDIVGYLDENFPEDKIEELKNQVRNLDEVDPDSLRFADEETVTKRIIEQNIGSLSQTFVDNSNEFDMPFYREIYIRPNNLEDYEFIIQNMENIKIDGVEKIWRDIPRSQSYVETLLTLNQWVRVVGAIFIFIFASISILVMANILRITVYSHKEEIEIMRLVGATNNYIRLPFIVEGIYYNLIAAVIVIASFIPSLIAIMPRLQFWIGVGDGLSLQIYITLAITILSGILVGILTTYLTIQRYLQL